MTAQPPAQHCASARPAAGSGDQSAAVRIPLSSVGPNPPPISPTSAQTPAPGDDDDYVYEPTGHL
ncbi:hypothetical protein TCAP_06759 [Tolypocladium capitatum]|uniref:Uncharacterized protein n=1 Tax=Tolypocladium capitatum TaxID=45235 RepID=A0A2K3Q6Y8_9HYPO|nr:hypothetical protein TCAP_06759 [Tolypocladium capitatum]